MSRPLVLWHLVAAVAIIMLASWWLTKQLGGQGEDAYPNRPIHVVVPFKAGGGSDTFVRIMQQGIEQDGLLEQPLVIINQDGGIGTIGSREVKNAKPDGYKILCHHNAIITAKLVETVSYGPEAFEPIALTGETSMVVVVREDAPFESLSDLLEQARVTPKQVRFGANKGAPPFFATLQLEKEWPGADFNIVSAGGGADRYSKILGGHLEAGIFSLSEFLDFRNTEGASADQNIRAIAVLSRQRHEAIPDVPTATEVGLPVVLSNANYWWAPKGTPQAIVEKLATTLERAMQNETVLKELGRLRIDAVFDRGVSFQRRMDETVSSFEAVTSRSQTPLPNFMLYVSALVTALLAWVGWESWKEKGDETQATSPLSTRQPRVAIAALAILCGYVWLLGKGWIPFALMSAAMVLAVGGVMLLAGAKGRWVVLIELALLTGFGTHFTFSEILVTPLP